MSTEAKRARDRERKRERRADPAFRDAEAERHRRYRENNHEVASSYNDVRRTEANAAAEARNTEALAIMTGGDTSAMAAAGWKPIDPNDGFWEAAIARDREAHDELIRRRAEDRALMRAVADDGFDVKTWKRADMARLRKELGL